MFGEVKHEVLAVIPSSTLGYRLRVNTEISHNLILGQTAKEVWGLLQAYFPGLEAGCDSNPRTRDVWFVALLHEVPWTCRASRRVARCSPPPPSSAGHSPLGILPLESCTALLPACSPPCWAWAKAFLKGGQVCPAWSPTPGSFEHISALPLPPNTYLTSGKSLNLSVLRQNKDNTTSFSLHFVCLLQLRCKLLRARFVFSVCSVPIKTEPWSQLGPWGTAAVLLLSLIIIITNAIRSKTLPVWVIFGVKLVIPESNRYM